MASAAEFKVLTPAPALYAITFAEESNAPPIVLPDAPSSAIPPPAFPPRAEAPVKSVPTKFPWIRFPIAPASWRKIPLPPFPVTTFPWPAADPPMRLFDEPTSAIPPFALASTAAPVRSTPTSFCWITPPDVPAPR